jgi:hypothetical protein
MGTARILAFLVEETRTGFALLGGNQSDQVKISGTSSYPKPRWKVLGCRWPKSTGRTRQSGYRIGITRGRDSGRLVFESGDTIVNTECWWDPDVKVDKGTYKGYATRMASKTDGRNGQKREAIWLGEAVPVNGNRRKSNGIFIHKGTSPNHSDGCIVCSSREVLKIWDAVVPKEQANITISIRDE